MTTMHVQVLGGLGSRMRAVVGAIAWARNNNCNVKVHWPWAEHSEDLKCFPVWFSELFDSPCEENRMAVPQRTGWPHTPLPWLGGYGIRTCDPVACELEGLNLDGWPYVEDWQPSAFTKELIDAVDWPMGTVVGVHIRKAIAQPDCPPIAWYIERMGEIKLDFHVDRFFLSCDHPDSEREVKHAFPETFCQHRSYLYDRVGIAMAAADLYLLTRPQWMIGCYDSSYSELAGWMRGGVYIHGKGGEGWMKGGRFENLRTPAVPEDIEAALAGESNG